MSNTDIPASRNIVTTIPGPKSAALHERRKAAVANGAGCALPVYIDRAKGAIFVDVDGNAFIDMGSGIGVTTVGHANDSVVEAAKNQLEKLTHTLFTVTPYEGYVAVAEKLSEITPGKFAKKSILVNSGAEAVENAVKIARKFTGKSAIAALDHSYHGRTNLTMALNYKAVPYNLGFGPFASDIYHAPNSYPYQDGLTGEEAAKKTIKYLEKHIGAEQLAALIFEPIQGEGGFIVPADGYLPALQKWANANNVVVIADEIQSGTARTGYWYASEYFGIEPDLVLSAKGMGGGLPIAAVTGKAEIMDSTNPGSLGGTFGGNPVACAAVLGVYKEIEEQKLLDRAKQIGTKLISAFKELKDEFDFVGDVRGMGAMVALEFVHPGTKDPYPEVVKKIVSYAAGQGVLLLDAGTFNNVVRTLPSLAITDAQLDDALAVIKEAFSQAV